MIHIMIHSMMKKIKLSRLALFKYMQKVSTCRCKADKKANVTGELNISDVESYANFCVYGQLGILTDDNLTPEEKNRKIKAILFDLFKL